MNKEIENDELQIKTIETPEAGVKRLALHILQASEANLIKKNDLNEGIHESRKYFKKYRALIRLVRHEIGESHYNFHNLRIRDAGRKIAQVRDSWVNVETMNSLFEDYVNEKDDCAFKNIRNYLLSEYNRMIQKIKDDKTIKSVCEDIHIVQKQIGKLVITSRDFSAFDQGIGRVYYRGVIAMNRALKDPNAENLHQWRKRTKYLGYQLGYLHQIWPEMLAVYEELFGQLADLLGEDHDLAVLRAVLLQEPSVSVGNIGKLLTQIEQRRNMLQKKIWPLGIRLFSEPPDVFTNRLGIYWDVMKTHTNDGN